MGGVLTEYYFFGGQETDLGFWAVPFGWRKSYDFFVLGKFELQIVQKRAFSRGGTQNVGTKMTSGNRPGGVLTEYYFFGP